MLATAYIRISPEYHRPACEYGRSGSLVVRPGRRVKRPIQSAAAHHLLSAMLEREHLNGSSLRLVHGDDGRPLLYRDDKLSTIAVSLSHSRAIAACAISDLGAIGIDIEFHADRPFEAIAATAFGPKEQRAVAREGLKAFYRIWTLREALAKAAIGGISRLTDGRDYFGEAPSDGIWRSTIDSQAWVFWSGAIADDYAIAVAMALQASLEITPVVSMTMQSFASYHMRLA
jgi:phosphopantetheinyl transferase